MSLQNQLYQLKTGNAAAKSGIIPDDSSPSKSETDKATDRTPIKSDPMAGDASSKTNELMAELLNVKKRLKKEEDNRK